MMNYKGYLARVIFDDEADIFHGEIANIRDVVTFQGQTVTDLRNAFEESVEDYLDFCRELGEKPNPPFSGQLTVRLSKEQHKAVVMAAEKAGKGVDDWIAEILQNAVNLTPNANPAGESRTA